jgi:predicted nucleotidyltransferase
LRREHELFVQWCLSQDSLGCMLCEYVTLCPLFKVFADAPAAQTGVSRKLSASGAGGEGAALNWLQWAMAAYSSLESQWVELEAERLCLALEEGASSDGKTETVTANKPPTTTKKKNKKANKKNSIKAAAPVAVPFTAGDVAAAAAAGVEVSVYVDSCVSQVDPSAVSPLNADKAVVPLTEETTPTRDPDVTILEDTAPALGVEVSVYVDSCVSQTVDPSAVPSPLDVDIAVVPLTEETTPTRDPDVTILEDTAPVEVSSESLDSQLETGPSGAETSPCGEGGGGEGGEVTEAAAVEEGETSEEETQCSDRVVSLQLSHSSTASSPQSRPVSASREDASLARSSRDMTDADAASHVVSPSGSRGAAVKSHRGDFLRSECEGGDRPNTDSTSRMDLIRWDEQRNLADRLTEDVLSMATSLHRIANMRRPWQMAAVERVRAVIHSLWPHAQCDIFGSFGTGLAIPSSDVDIVVSGVGIAHQLHWWGGKAVTAIAALTHHLQQRDWVSTIRAIEHTVMPVIKLTTASVPMPPLLGGGGERKDFRGVRH